MKAVKKFQDHKQQVSEEELLDLYDHLATKWARKMEKRQRAKQMRQALSTQ